MVFFEENVQIGFECFIFLGKQVCKIKINLNNFIFSCFIPINNRNSRFYWSKPFVVDENKIIFIYLYFRCLSFSYYEVVFYKNINELSSLIIELKNNDKKRRKIGENGRIKYNTFFNSTKVAKFIFEKSLNLKLSEKYFWNK